MTKTLINLAAMALCTHGLVHLMGAVVYMGLGSLHGLPYKTTLADRWDVGVAGMAFYGLMWAVAAAAFVVGGMALASGTHWWVPATAAAASLSLLLTLLDWRVAYMGAIADVTVLTGVALAAMMSWQS